MACLSQVSEQWILESNGRVQKNLILTEKDTEERRAHTRKVSVGKTQLSSMELLLSFHYASFWKDIDENSSCIRATQRERHDFALGRVEVIFLNYG